MRLHPVKSTAAQPAVAYLPHWLPVPWEIRANLTKIYLKDHKSPPSPGKGEAHQSGTFFWLPVTVVDFGSLSARVFMVPDVAFGLPVGGDTLPDQGWAPIEPDAGLDISSY